MLPPLTLNAWLRYHIIRRILAGLDDVRSVLEIGAGQGALGARLARRFAYVGVEPDAASFAIAKARIEGAGYGTVLNGTETAVHPASAFDLVCAFEVLEHIEGDLAALQTWGARLRPGGCLLLSVPAFARRFAAGDRHAGHYRRYEREQITALLRDAGFADTVVLTYGFPFGNLLERARNVLARIDRGGGTREERSAASGRWRQPPSMLGWLTMLVTLPFRYMQRPFARTQLGTGFVVLGRRAR